MRSQNCLLTLVSLSSLLITSFPVEGAILNPPELRSRSERKILQAPFLFKAKKLADESLKNSALIIIAGKLVSSGKIDQALQLTGEIKDESPKNSVLIFIAGALASVGKIDQALQLAREIKDESSKNWALSRIGGELASVGKIDQALQLTREIKDESPKNSELTRL